MRKVSFDKSRTVQLYLHACVRALYNVHKQWSSANESAVGTDYRKVQKVVAPLLLLEFVACGSLLRLSGHNF